MAATQYFTANIIRYISGTSYSSVFMPARKLARARKDKLIHKRTFAYKESKALHVQAKMACGAVEVYIHSFVT
jgi:hypothetical protein